MFHVKRLQEDTDLLQQAFEKHNIALTEEQVELIVEYATLLESWNKKVNLVSRKDQDRILSKHILHSLSIAFFYKFTATDKVLDIGTGGGLPSIPLKILFPEASFLLTDSVGKKILAVKDIIEKLKLKKISAVQVRAEEIFKIHKSDFVLARAVAPLAEICVWIEHLLKPNTKLICLKGGKLDKEIAEAKKIRVVKSVLQRPIEFLGEGFEEKFIIEVQFHNIKE
jgi:16S rRNA (guanine527-N7)-methyltransferase